MQLDDAILKDHYAHLVELPFFPEILGFMQSSPIMALALEGEGIIQKVRDFIGPTDSTKAEKVRSRRSRRGQNAQCRTCIRLQ